MNKMLTAATLVALSSLSSTAMAGHAFVRAEAGYSEAEASLGRFSEKENDTAAYFGGGYWFTPNIGVEGHAGALYSEYLGNDRDFDLVSFGVGLTAKKNFGADGNGFFVGGRAGIACMTAQVREDDWDVEDDESSTKPYYGVNVGYDFSNRWGLSLNYTRHRGEFDGIDVDVDVIGFGGEFRF